MSITQYIDSKLVSNQKIRDLVKSGDTPRSKTGSNSPEVIGGLGETVGAGIDNVSLIWSRKKDSRLFPVLQNFLSIYMDSNYVLGRKIGLVWTRTWSSSTGTLYSEKDDYNGGTLCRLSLSGEDCGRNTNARLRGFLLWCSRNLTKVKCSRIDIAVDDYNKQLKVCDIEQALISGNYTGFRTGKITTNYGSKFGGFTVNLGSRESEKFVRFYDKFAESHGCVDCYRWEVEYKDSLAQSVYLAILECPLEGADYQQFLIDIALSSVDFVDKNDKNIDRNHRLEWWDAWINKLVTTYIKLKSLRTTTTISKKKNWIKRSVSKSLALLQKALGDIGLNTFIEQIIQEANNRITSLDLLIVDDYGRNWENCCL